MIENTNQIRNSILFVLQRNGYYSLSLNKLTQLLKLLEMSQATQPSTILQSTFIGIIRLYQKSKDKIPAHVNNQKFSYISKDIKQLLINTITQVHQILLGKQQMINANYNNPYNFGMYYSPQTNNMHNSNGLHNMQGSGLGNMQVNMHGNIHGNMQGNIHGNMQGNMQGNIQGNNHGNNLYNIQGNGLNNISSNLHNINNNVQSNLHNSFDQTMQPLSVHQQMKKYIQQNKILSYYHMMNQSLNSQINLPLNLPNMPNSYINMLQNNIALNSIKNTQNLSSNTNKYSYNNNSLYSQSPSSIIPQQFMGNYQMNMLNNFNSLSHNQQYNNNIQKLNQNNNNYMNKTYNINQQQQITKNIIDQNDNLNKKNININTQKNINTNTNKYYQSKKNKDKQKQKEKQKQKVQSTNKQSKNIFNISKDKEKINNQNKSKTPQKEKVKKNQLRKSSIDSNDFLPKTLPFPQTKKLKQANQIFKDCACKGFYQYENSFQCQQCKHKLHYKCLKIPQNIQKKQQVIVCAHCQMKLMDPLNIVQKVIGQYYLMNITERKLSVFINFKQYEQYWPDRNSKYQIQVRCIRSGEHLNNLQITWPDQSMLKINGQRIIQIPALQSNSSLKKRKDYSIMMTHNIFNSYKNNNQIDQEKVQFNLQLKTLPLDEINKKKIRNQYVFALGIYLVKKLNTDQLYAKVMDNQRINDNSFLKNLMNSSENQVQIDKITIKLLDPFSWDLIKTPARGSKCTHIQCFDLKNFISLMYSAKNRTWRCPVCSKDSRKFMIDQGQQEILKKAEQLTPTPKEVLIYKEGQIAFKIQKDNDDDDEIQMPSNNLSKTKKIFKQRKEENSKDS